MLTIENPRALFMFHKTGLFTAPKHDSVYKTADSSPAMRLTNASIENESSNTNDGNRIQRHVLMFDVHWCGLSKSNCSEFGESSAWSSEFGESSLLLLELFYEIQIQNMREGVFKAFSTYFNKFVEIQQTLLKFNKLVEIQKSLLKFNNDC
jgi:hypothetical protein